MNDTDESLFAWDEHAYRAGVEREVNEEIKIESRFEDRIVALLNDDSTEVGRVHLGVACASAGLLRHGWLRWIEADNCNKTNAPALNPGWFLFEACLPVGGLARY